MTPKFAAAYAEQVKKARAEGMAQGKKDVLDELEKRQEENRIIRGNMWATPIWLTDWIAAKRAEAQKQEGTKWTTK